MRLISWRSALVYTQLSRSTLPRYHACSSSSTPSTSFTTTQSRTRSPDRSIVLVCHAACYTESRDRPVGGRVASPMQGGTGHAQLSPPTAALARGSRLGVAIAPRRLGPADLLPRHEPVRAVGLHSRGGHCVQSR